MKSRKRRTEGNVDCKKKKGREGKEGGEKRG